MKTLKYSTPSEIVEAGVSRANSDDPLAIRNGIIYVIAEDMFDQLLEFVEEKDFVRALKRLDHIQQIFEIERDLDPANINREDFIEKMMRLFPK